MRLDYNLIALTELEERYQLFYLVAKPTTRLPVSVLGSPVECGVQSKLLLLQFSGQANYRQRVEHSGMNSLIANSPLKTIRYRGGGGEKGGERGWGAASAKLCYEIIWFINWVDNGNWPP